MTKEEFLKQISSRDRSSAVSVHLLTDGAQHASAPSLKELLQLDEARLSEEALVVLDIIENDKEFGCHKEYQEFKWMVAAYTNLQDAFPTIYFDEQDQNVIFAQNYFYYEALAILREFMYCGLNNMTTSARHLVRTFIEFNLRQLYFYERCRRETSFASLKLYLSDGVVPSNQSIINYLFPNSPFFKPVKKAIQVIIKGLSNSSSHAFDPLHSARGLGRLRHEYSLDSMLFWLTMYSSFNAVLWSYYMIFPTVLRPRDVIRKFGFNYVPGLFFTNEQHLAIKKTFREGEMELFVNAEPIKSELANLDETYAGFQDLTDDEILQTWGEDGHPESFLIGYARILAKMRVINEMLANKFSVDVIEETTANYINVKTDLGLATSYSFWQKNYKSM